MYLSLIELYSMKMISNDTSIFTNKTMGFCKVGIKWCVKLFISANYLNTQMRVQCFKGHNNMNDFIVKYNFTTVKIELLVVDYF